MGFSIFEDIPLGFLITTDLSEREPLRNPYGTTTMPRNRENSVKYEKFRCDSCGARRFGTVAGNVCFNCPPGADADTGDQEGGE